jgi:methionyl-tRNA formyltransferase
MRICFIGTVELSAVLFRHLLEKDAELAGLITSEDNSQNTDYADLCALAEANDIPVLKTANVNSANTLQWVDSRQADVIFCFGWSRLLKSEILNLTRLGVIGFHPAELPMNRGRHPLIWALALGLPHTASTFFFMEEGADSGNILSQVIVPIHYEDDARSLYDRIAETAVEQLDVFLPQLAIGNYVSRPQNHDIATHWRKRGTPDGRIDFRMPARGIYNLVRALAHPYAGAHFRFSGADIKVWAVKEVPDLLLHLEPGKVYYEDDKVVRVKCGADSVDIPKEVFAEAPETGSYLQ